MPVKRVKKGNKAGYQYGDSGTVYTYTAGDAASRESARRKAVRQSRAIHAQQRPKK